MRTDTPPFRLDMVWVRPWVARAIGAGMALALAGASLKAWAAPAAWPDGQGGAWAAQPGLTADAEGEPPGPPPGVVMRAPGSAMPGRAGRLVDFQGAVWFFDVAQGRWEEGLRNRAVTGGDRLSTGADGRAEVRLGSTELRLGPRTELEFVDVGEDRLVWRLSTGSLAWRVRRHEIARESEVRAAGVRVRAEGPGHYRLEVDDAVVWASAWRGSLRVDSGDQLVQVPAGRRAEFMRPGPGSGTVVTWSTPLRDEFADWVARDEVRDAQQASASAAYVSPEMTGIEDLDRHGRWERHPEFGMVWTPLVVAAGWEPFRHGRWVWHVRWGWTWVDAAPWGFAPFHYGRWARWGGRWCWVPGPYLARPVFSPALVAWSGPPRPGVSVSVGVNLHGRHWAPLPPRHVHPPSPRWGVTDDPRRRHPEPHGRVPPLETPVRLPAPEVHGRIPAPELHGRVPAPEAHGRHPVTREPHLPAVSTVPTVRPPRPLTPAEPVEQAPREAPRAVVERPRGGDRAHRDQRPDAATIPAPAARARVPEAMRDRPRERQQTL